MQDSPARKKPTLPPRDCAACGTSFVPGGSRAERCPECSHARALAQKSASKRAARAEARDADPPAECSIGGCGTKLRRNNSTGRCQEHRYIPGEGMGTCAQGGCGARLRRDNKSGYCEAHKYATARMPERFCAAGKCENKLRGDNQSGYCEDHSHLKPAVIAFRERFYARQREANARKPDLRLTCAEEGCWNRLRSDNTTGRCREHHYEPLDMPECAVGGCGNRLTASNKGDRCNEHRAMYWAPDAPKCGAKGCGKTLHADNRLGYCHEHRRLSPLHRQYMRDYYERNATQFREYARFYREVYVEEVRAASTAWRLANPEARLASHARRRQRVEADMDSVDRLLSTLYRIAIKNDPCFYCGTIETHHVDHYFPLAKGATDHFFNLVRSCSACNLSKMTTCGTAFLLRKMAPSVAA